ncbi:SpoIIE family protein phosphatase [Nonomuraea maritima]|uniref:SpoIIE family protein phosphatase n=1 Tax=Nonomuraea maritima TaxID=683260 RepID=UPI003714BD93
MAPGERSARLLTAPAVAVLDAEGTVTGWTQGATELLGYHADEVVGRSSAFLSPGDGAQRFATWARTHGRLDAWSGLAEFRHRDGHTIVLHLDGRRLTTAEGKPAWIFMVRPTSTERAADSVAEVLIRQSPIATWIWDRELRCVWRNDRARQVQALFRYGPGMPQENAPARGNERARRALQAVLTHGVPVTDTEVVWPAADGLGNRTLSVSIFRLEGTDGDPVGVCSMAIDITQSQARRRVALLSEASARIGTTLDIRHTAQELAEFAMPALADFVTVDLDETVLSDLLPLQRPAATRAATFRRVGMASVHDELPESLWQPGKPLFVSLSTPHTKVLYSGRPHFEPELDTSPGNWLDHDPDRALVVRKTGMHSLMLIPIRARGVILGVAVFARTVNPTPFNEDDLMLAEDLVAQAALSLDTARRFTRERIAAFALNRDLLPRRLHGGDSLDLAYQYRPAGAREGVGGDWYDTIPLSGGRTALVVGDVVGHGVPAAAIMGQLRTAINTLVVMDLQPGELLTHLDDLFDDLDRRDLDENDIPFHPLGATCLYAVYDPATRSCAMTTAGHPPPLIATPDGAVTFPELTTGPPVGIGMGSYETATFDLPAGSLIALYTNGLIQRRGEDLDAGMERLRTILSDGADLPLGRLCTGVIDAAVGTLPPEDDIALLMARTR